MPVTCTQEDRRLIANISGELDHHGAQEVMQQLQRNIDAALPKELVLDLSQLSFTDSSGIAVLLRARKHMGQLQGKVCVVNTPQQAQKVFQAAGLYQLLEFQ